MRTGDLRQQKEQIGQCPHPVGDDDPVGIFPGCGSPPINPEKNSQCIRQRGGNEEHRRIKSEGKPKRRKKTERRQNLQNPNPQVPPRIDGSRGAKTGKGRVGKPVEKIRKNKEKHAVGM